MSEEKKLGTKEIDEIIDFMDELAVKGMSIMKDGLGLDDLPKILDPSLFNKAKAAISGMGDVDDELKDLDKEEIKHIISKLVDIGAHVIDELKKESAND